MSFLCHSIRINCFLSKLIDLLTCIILPNSAYKVIWDSVIIIFLLLNIYLIPLKFAFIDSKFDKGNFNY